MWNSHYFLSNLVGQFWVCGTNSRAIAGSLKDSELNKFFWRETFQKVGAKVAPELGRWDGKKLTLAKDTSKKAKVLIKAFDQCLGLGD